MKILICHPSKPVGAALQRTVQDAFSDARSLYVSSLSQAYHVTEHREPNCLMIDAALAANPDFELLASLLGLMGIGCILIESGAMPTLPVALQGVRVIPTEPTPQMVRQAVLSCVERRVVPRPAKITPPAETGFDPQHVIMIGASTGGIDALIQTLRHFGPSSPPLLIVQHTGGNFVASLVRLLGGMTSARVRAVTARMALEPGHVYLPADNMAHLALCKKQGLAACLHKGAAVSGHCPSIDVMFTSAVHHARHVSAALLTGMGQDGAQGLLALRQAGAHTFGQDKETSVVYGMPRIAMEIGAVSQQLPIAKIGPALLRTARATGRVAQ